MAFNRLCPLSVTAGSRPVQGSNDVHLRRWIQTVINVKYYPTWYKYSETGKESEINIDREKNEGEKKGLNDTKWDKKYRSLEIGWLKLNIQFLFSISEWGFSI